MFNKKKLKAFILCMICITTVLRCSSTGKFTTVASDYRIDPEKSIAVFSGQNDDNNIQLAELIAEKFSATGKFKVLSQADIEKLVPRYPLNLNFIDFSYINDKDNSYSPAYVSRYCKAQIDTVQKLVKTDYILIVWIDQMEQSGSKMMFIRSRLFAYPGGIPTGYSNRWNGNSHCCLAPKGWGNLFKNSSIDLVEEIIEKTN